MYQLQYPYYLSFQDTDGNSQEIVINVWLAKTRTKKYRIIVRDSADEGTWVIADIPVDGYEHTSMFHSAARMWGIAEYFRVAPYEVEHLRGAEIGILDMSPPWKLDMCEFKKGRFYKDEIEKFYKDMNLSIEECWGH